MSTTQAPSFCRCAGMTAGLCVVCAAKVPRLTPTQARQARVFRQLFEPCEDEIEGEDPDYGF